jgi:hypothetical protein
MLGTDCPFRNIACNSVCALYIADMDGFRGCSLKLIAISLVRLEDKYGLTDK